MRPIWEKRHNLGLTCYSACVSHMSRLCSTVMLFLDFFLLARSPSPRTESQGWSGQVAGCLDHPAYNPLRGPGAEGTHFILNLPGDLTSVLQARRCVRAEARSGGRISPWNEAGGPREPEQL